MNSKEIKQLLCDQKIEASPHDMRDPLDIGLALGLLGLKHVATEISGTYDEKTARFMRLRGLVVVPSGFAQNVFMAVPASEVEV